ncbi:MAG TPA: slipin family protein [Polyangiaceae bacterium]|nr:slipin family protein [Polyangiaceae bacterium]
MKPNVVTVLIWLAGAIAAWVALAATGTPAISLAVGGGAFFLSLAPQIANQWERAIVLRLGRFHAAKGPGVFFLMPFLDRVSSWVDQRVVTTSFTAEQTLTRDTVPVNVDAVLFWHVHDPEKAALEVQSYAGAVGWAAQTALRDLIGRTSLADMLVGREKMERSLQDMIDQRVGQWGVTVQAVEMRDVVIPEELQDAMSREAQAEREKNARVILGDAEVLIAKQFAEASQLYRDNPVALHLRAMNMLYEGLKEKGALMVVPSSAVETMGLGAFAGLSALAGGKAPSGTGTPT